MTQDLENVNHIELARNACMAGVKYIQIRSKKLSSEELTETVSAIVELAKHTGSKIIINDNVAVTLNTGADGVHLGKDDMPVEAARAILGPDKIIGGTANTMGDIRNLAAAGVNYIGLGPFRFTQTKRNLSPYLGIDGIAQIASNMHEEGIDIPVYAIGGIDMRDIRSILDTGIHGVAISSAVNLAAVSENMLKKIREEIESVEYRNKNQLTSRT